MDHLMKRHIEEIEVIPGYEPRNETHEFLVAKKKLEEDGHGCCYICGATKDIQTHHYGIEWALWNDCDPKKLKEFLLSWDIYGYSHAMQDQGIYSPDDIRNLMNLCEKHHINKFSGIHLMTFPLWISQKVTRDGDNPVDQAEKLEEK